MCGRGGGDRLALYLWKEKKSGKRGRANENRGCFGVGNDIH